MSRYDSPLDDGDERDSDEVIHYGPCDVRLRMSPDGKRVRVTLEGEQYDRRRYEVGGVKLGGAHLNFTDQTMTLTDCRVRFEWLNGGLGMYPGLVIEEV